MIDTDGNLHALEKHLFEQEEYDRYQELLDAEEERNKLEDDLISAEAKLAKAMNSLEKLVQLNDDYSPFGGELLQDRIVRTWDNARATIRELKERT